jgi:xanthine dehydrogenase YagR molybdenum-binding subunit
MKDWPSSSELRHVGRRSPRLSAIEKVTGRARYSADVQMSGMLHAVVVRSRIPRGRVVSIDATAADRVPGVRLILTLRNFPAMPEERSPEGELVSRRAPISDEIRFVGEEIGAVVAETETAAEEAASLLEIQYEPAPAVIEPEDALKPGAPPLGSNGNLVGGKPEVAERGDVRRGETEAELVMEERYSTEVQHHNPLEPHCCVAVWQRGVLTLFDSNQGVHAVKDHLVARLGLPENRIRVVNEYVGGGFGSKNRSKPYHYIAAIAAKMTGRPVRLWTNRRDEFIAARHRAKSRHRLRGGVRKDGTLTFLFHETVGQDGADTLLAGVAAGTGVTERLYRCPNVRTEVSQVHTNTQSPVVFRGPLAAEETFCLEQFVDELAHLAKMDPLEFRLRNYADVDPVSGLPYSSKGLRRCCELGAERFGWRWREPGSVREGAKRRGIGVGSAILGDLDYEPSQVWVAWNADGTANVVAGVSDIGTGVEQVLVQIAAEELGLELEHVTIVMGDSLATPYSIDSSYGSRTTMLVGPAVRAAAEEARVALLAFAAKQTNLPAKDLMVADSVISSRRDPTRRVAVKEVTRAAGREQIRAIGRRHPAMPGVAVANFAAHFVEVEVDGDTGQVRVLRAVCAHECGRWINPLLVESQIQGGFLQGMGMALFEERSMDRRNGMMLNDSMLSYFMPTAVDAPDELVAVEVPLLDPSNSINAKGIGEPPLVASGAAIANAVYNAIGARVRAYPITPDKVLKALGSVRAG